MVINMKDNPLKSCELCPRKCGVDRTKGELGFCRSSEKIRIAKSSLHFWEEPCISGEKGSGTVFFSYCTLKCVYCQNFGISTQNYGRDITIDELSECFLDLQNQGANNINLVTPTHFVAQIISAIEIARKKGLVLPIVYNTSGYENVETIKMLDGYVDIFLPDLKYFDDKYAVKYSNAKDYFKTATAAIKQMYNQVGKCEFDKNGIIRKGVVVRHLMLPGLLFDTKKVLDYLYSEYGNNIYISIMSQYTPLSTLPCNFPELNRRINPKHYDAIIDYAVNLGIENAYIQEGTSASESFIPDFYDDN